MTTLRNHKGFVLASTAEASLARFEAVHGVIPITSAGRSVAEQQALINRWNAGGAKNRPPYLYQPAMPATASRHVVSGGIAIDTSGNGIALMHKYGEEFGWYFNFAYDLVHFEYEAAKDKHKGATVAATAASHPAGYSAVTAERQHFLNQIGQHLIVDGLVGPATVKAYKAYQTHLKKVGFYSGKIDGDWGPATQAGFAKDLAAGAKK